MTYRDRITAAQARRQTPIPAAPPMVCDSTPYECAGIFEVIGQALDDIKGEQSAARQAFSELAERTASQETHAKNLWHQVRSVDESVKALPTYFAQALGRHEDTCSGRDYAKAKLTSSTTRPDMLAPATPDGGGLLAAGIPVSKLILYFGSGIGAAIAGAGYLLSLLGVFGN